MSERGGDGLGLRPQAFTSVSGTLWTSCGHLDSEVAFIFRGAEQGEVLLREEKGPLHAWLVSGGAGLGPVHRTPNWPSFPQEGLWEEDWDMTGAGTIIFWHFLFHSAGGGGWGRLFMIC